jgi:hypothetical protein
MVLAYSRKLFCYKMAATMKKIRAFSAALCLVGLVILGSPVSSKNSQEQDVSGPSLIPLLWTQGQSPEMIRQVIREIADSGNTGFVWESRPHPDYLGPGWWRDLGVAIAEARRLGLEVWIFDEWMYPSGVAGGKVIEENPAYTHHVLVERSLVLEGPISEKIWEIPGGLKKSETIVSVAAFPDPPNPELHSIDLRPAAAVSNLQKIQWTVPTGRWRLCWCVSNPELPRSGWRMDTMIDVFNPKAVAAFIRLTHEATYKHYAADFGQTIKGFFSDETGFRNVTSYRSLPGEPGMPMPWSPAFLGYFQNLKGCDPTPLLPALWYDLGPAGRAARFDLMDAFSSCLAETFFKPQQEWCRAHGVKLIGHLVEDNGADNQLGYGTGHWFRSMQYLDVPGIDVVGYQVTPGLESGTNRWSLNSGPDWDQEYFQFGLPAMARGAALVKNSPEIFSEAFGAYGWSEGLRMVKWIGDWHIVNGLNMLSPHAFTMKHNDPDCPPHFNRSSGNPQWRYYSAWADYIRRLQKISRRSTPEFDAVILYTGESGWTGPAQSVSPLVRLLESRQISTVVLPYEVWEKEGTIENGRWNFQGRSFEALALPFVRYISPRTIARLANFAEQGGRVAVIDRWPEGSLDGRGDAEVTESIEKLKRAQGAYLISFPQLGASFSSIAKITFSPSTPGLVVSRRNDSDGEWIFLQNRSLDQGVKGRVLMKNVKGQCVRFDGETGKYYAVPSDQKPEGLQVEVDLAPYALCCLRIGAHVPDGETPPSYSRREEIRADWKITQVDEEGHETKSLDSKKTLEDWRGWEGFDHYAGTIRYKASFPLDSNSYGRAVGIDTGRVEEIAELKINGQSAGIRLCPPYIWDIKDLVIPGENIIEIDITNTAAVRWPDSFSRGDAAGGLFGPVFILKGK